MYGTSNREFKLGTIWARERKMLHAHISICPILCHCQLFLCQREWMVYCKLKTINTFFERMLWWGKHCWQLLMCAHIFITAVQFSHGMLCSHGWIYIREREREPGPISKMGVLSCMYKDFEYIITLTGSFWLIAWSCTSLISNKDQHFVWAGTL